MQFNPNTKHCTSVQFIYQNLLQFVILLATIINNKKYKEPGLLILEQTTF